MDHVLSRLPRINNDKVLVGYDKADDAGVYLVSPELALVQTVDFFTPIVDDPFVYGQISAANSLSDVYAMGGRPLSALSIAAYPPHGEQDVLAEIMRGGLEKLREADCALLGGHSVADEEIKFGYAVTGVIHPQRVLTNGGAREGDGLIFTKRIGTGVVATAHKRGLARPADVEAAIQSMLGLNRSACEIMLRHPVHACTDVTGFGMLGHGREVAQASQVTLEIDHSRIQWLPGALEYAAQGAIPGGLKNNREFASCAVDIRAELAPEVESLLYDPQTSGGLLISVAPESAGELVEELRGAGLPAGAIGRAVARQQHAIVII